MSNITDAMAAADEDDYPSLRKRRHRRLNDLDTSTEEDDDKDEDFKGSRSVFTAVFIFELRRTGHEHS